MNVEFPSGSTMSTITQYMTAEDLWQLPSDGMRHELIRGELQTMPPSGFEHGVVGINLSTPLNQHTKGNQLGLVVGGGDGLSHRPKSGHGARLRHRFCESGAN